MGFGPSKKARKSSFLKGMQNYPGSNCGIPRDMESITERGGHVASKIRYQIKLGFTQVIFLSTAWKKISLKEQALGFSNLLSISPPSASPRNPPYTSLNLSLPLDSIPSSLSDRDSNRCQITHTSYYHHYWLVTDSPHPLGKLTNVTTPRTLTADIPASPYP